jgi:hypothetical protein
MSFVHPGALSSNEELDFVKERIAAGATPWTAEYDRLSQADCLKRSPHSSVKIDSSGPDASRSTPLRFATLRLNQAGTKTLTSLLVEHAQHT